MQKGQYREGPTPQDIITLPRDSLVAQRTDVAPKRNAYLNSVLGVSSEHLRSAAMNATKCCCITLFSHRPTYQGFRS
jgi:hypothetical protein